MQEPLRPLFFAGGFQAWVTASPESGGLSPQLQIVKPRIRRYSADSVTGRKLIALYSIHQSLHWFVTGLLVPVIALMQMEKGLDLFQIGTCITSSKFSLIRINYSDGLVKTHHLGLIGDIGC